MDVFLWEMHTPQCVFNGRKSIGELPSILVQEKVRRPFVVIDGELEKNEVEELLGVQSLGEEGLKLP